MSVLGERIKERRLSLRITQNDLADVLNKTQAQIWKYESGKTTPNADVIVEIARSLDTTADFLLGLTDDPNRPAHSMADLREDERLLLHLYRSKQPDQKQKLIDIIKVY